MTSSVSEVPPEKGSHITYDAVISLQGDVMAVQIVTVDEAKTFYPLFGLGANVALIFSGRAVKYFSQVRAYSAADSDKQYSSMACLTW